MKLVETRSNQTYTAPRVLLRSGTLLVVLLVAGMDAFVMTQQRRYKNIMLHSTTKSEPRNGSARQPSPIQAATRHACLSRMSASDDVDTTSTVTIQDKNGLSLTLGSLVRVTRPNLRAFHVAPKARGSFDEESKTFQPNPESKALVLPVGLRGIVTKLIDVEQTVLSANFPVEVQFTPGEYTEEGYDAPVSFKMHFGVKEIECVPE